MKYLLDEQITGKLFLNGMIFNKWKKSVRTDFLSLCLNETVAHATGRTDFSVFTFG